MYDSNVELLKQSITITTRCPIVIRNWASQHNVKIPRILWAGYQAMTRKEPDEMQKLNEKVTILADKLMRTQKKLWEIEGTMEQKNETKI